MTHSRRGVLVAFLALWPVLLLAVYRGAVPPAAARAVRGAGALQMQIAAGLAGYYRADAWLPIRVLVRNAGPQVTASLTVADGPQRAQNGVSATDQASYTYALVLPQDSVKQVTIYVPGADLGDSITVRLAANGQTQQRSVPITQVGLGPILAGVLSDSDAVLQQLHSGAALGGAVIPVPLDATTLSSNALALSNLDVLIIDSYNTASLSSAQVLALERWVRLGGTLIEIGGPTAAATLQGLSGPLLLVRPAPPQVLKTVPGLRTLATAPLPTTPFVASTGRLLSGTVVLDQQQIRIANAQNTAHALPLVVRASLGMGSVVYSALDPALSPLAEWPGLGRFWNLLTSPVRSDGAASATAFAGTLPNASQSDLQQEVAGVSVPSFTLFIALLAIYILLLIPLNFVLLARMRRSAWSWLTVPLLALLLVGAVYGQQYLTRGDNIRATVITILAGAQDAPALLAQQFVGLSVPTSGDYTLQAGLDSYGASFYSTTAAQPAGGQASVISEQDQHQVRLPQMAMWSSRDAAFEGFSATPHALVGTLHFTAAGALVGSVINQTAYTMETVVLASAWGYLPLGTLPPGGRASVNWMSGHANGLGTQQPQSLSDFLSTTAQILPATGGQLTADTNRVPFAQASLNALWLAKRLLAPLHDQPIPTNPGETRAMRIQSILEQLPLNTSPSSSGDVVAIGWSGQALTPLSVNGAGVQRRDTTLLVQSYRPAVVGPFVLNPGTVPVRLAGSSSTLQPGGYATGGGFTINSQSSAEFVAQLPQPMAGHRLRVSSLTLDLYQAAQVGGSVGPTTAALYNWRRGAWDAVDLSTGEVTAPHADRYVDAAGLVRVRLQATDATIGLADQNQGLAIGATGDTP